MLHDPHAVNVSHTPALLQVIQRLRHDRRYRDATGLCYLEGARSFIQAAESGVQFAAIVVSEPLLRVPPAEKLMRQQRRAGVPCHRVTPEVFRQMQGLPRASGIAAVARQWWTPLADAKPDAGLCWLAIEGVRAAGNLGTLLRTSAAVGGVGVMLIGVRADPFDPAVIRASMGAIFSQRVVRCSTPQFARWTQHHRCCVVAATPHADTDFRQVAYRHPLVLLLGEERKGLSDDVLRLCTATARIPMTRQTDSLNVAVAGSLLLYEVYRRYDGDVRRSHRPNRSA